MNSKPIVFSNVKLILPDRVIPGELLVENGIISGIAENGGKLDVPSAGEKPDFIDGEGLYLSPGFIDIHNHGRLGCDAMDGKTASMETIAHGQAEHGVTGFLAGTSTTAWEKSVEALGFLADYCAKETVKANKNGNNTIKGARCLGIYSEAAFFSMEKRGAHNPKYLKTRLSKEDMHVLADTGGEALKVVALSPELPGAEEWIRYFSGRGIPVAAAHSNATYDEALKGVELGVSLATHTFNGMRSLTHQEPGILGAVLDDDRVSCELIADGVHLAPVILSLAYKLKGPDRIILISDSVIVSGLPDGRYEKGDAIAIVKDGIIRVEDGRLSGSSLSLDKAVGNIAAFADISLSHAVKAASLNPARILGLEGRKGSIEQGKDADLIIFDENVEIKKVFIGGQLFLP
jgi:N-acetylglucosamine-6-phosphate deacetylase